MVTLCAQNVAADASCESISGSCWQSTYQTVAQHLGNPPVDEIQRQAEAGSPAHFFLARYMEATGLTKDNHSKYLSADLNRAVDIEQASIKYKKYLRKPQDLDVLNKLAYRAICAEGFKDSVFTQGALRARGCDRYFTPMGGPVSADLAAVNNKDSLLALVSTYYQPCAALKAVMDDVASFSDYIDYAEAATGLVRANTNYIQKQIDTKNVDESVHCKIMENREIFTKLSPIKNRADALEKRATPLLQRCSSQADQKQPSATGPESATTDYASQIARVINTETEIIRTASVLTGSEATWWKTLNISDVSCEGVRLVDRY